MQKMLSAQLGLNLCRSPLRGIATSAALNRNHYDSLGITPKATQADVKAAYYKLSMVYHPDKNKESSAASDKFRDISEAYEVLGNVKLRRLYDKGMIHVGSGFGQPFPEEHEDPSAGFYRSREVRTRPPPPSGRAPIYDFDEWARSHYGATFAKDMEMKRRRDIRKRMAEQEKQDVKMETILVCLAVLIAMGMYLSSDRSNQDRVDYIQQNNRVAEK